MLDAKKGVTERMEVQSGYIDVIRSAASKGSQEAKTVRAAPKDHGARSTSLPFS